MLSLSDNKYSNIKTYKVLIVDDSKVIHQVTNLTLDSMDFLDFKLDMISAYSTKEVLSVNPDIALAIVDIQMETDKCRIRSS